MTKKTRSYRTWDDFMLEELRDKEFAVGYLNESLADEEDLTLFLIALQRVMKAQKVKMTDLAKKSGVSREKLYTILSEKGNPEWKTLKAILDGLGYKLTIAG